MIADCRLACGRIELTGQTHASQAVLVTCMLTLAATPINNLQSSIYNPFTGLPQRPQNFVVAG